MPNYYIWTIGCQMNKAESERLASQLEKAGYQSAETAESADIILLNSCVVRQSAENRVINKLHALKSLKKANPDLTLAVTGCLVNSDVSPLRNRFSHVDHWFKAGEPLPWLEPALVLSEHPAPAVFVPIIQGCNNFCSYCIVPFRRGKERSRPVQEVVCEVKELVRRGAKEVTLLGQNVDSYGHDLQSKPELADLLEELNLIDGLARIRFLTNHPKDMNSRLIEAIARLDKVCESINLPVQAGDNKILNAMKRGYTIEHYCELVQELRKKVPGMAITTDVILGFPGEKKEQFENTYNLLEKVRFDKAHIAAYSPRPGTLAARELEDNVPAEEKKERVNRLEQLEEKIAREINASLLDKTVEILVEGKEKGKWSGRTHTDKLVFFSADGDYVGKMVDVRITRTSPWSLSGRLYEDRT